MVVPKIAVCPICGKKTYLRIEDGSYMYEYPIRIYCLNCHALIRGVYIMDESVGPKGLHLFNAEQLECWVNQGAEREIDADYLAEISGELPCKKAHVFDGKLCKSMPYIDASIQIPDIQRRINELRMFYVNMKEWEQWRSIAFQLLNDDEIGFVGAALRNKMGQYDYPCSDYLKSLHCLQEVVRQETRYIFVGNSQDKTVGTLIGQLSTVDKNELHEFIDRLGGFSVIISSYKKIISIFSSFMSVYPNLLPAETYLQYLRKDDSDLGIATCAFSDIKMYYLDAYEVLLSLMDIVIGFDNYLVRGSFFKYNECYTNYYNSNKKIHDRYYSKYMTDDFDRYKAVENGKRADLIELGEPIQGIVQIPADRYLRNAISHNTYKYDGLSQVITAYDQRDVTKINLQLSLLEMAVDCLALARSTVMFSEIVLFILRQEESSYRSALHPRYYSDLRRNDKCPCGSNKKYKNCCMLDVQSMVSRN